MKGRPVWQRSVRALGRLPLSIYIYGFGLIVVLPAILFSATLILQFSRQQQELAESEVANAAQGITASIDRELTGMITTARVLATSPLLNASDELELHRAAVAALANSGTVAALIASDFQPIFTTSLPFGHRRAERKSARPIIAQVFQTNEPQVSNLSYSSSLGQFTVFVAVPVLRSDGTRSVLAVETPVDRLKESIEPVGRYPGLTVEVRDRDGRMLGTPVSRSDEDGEATEPPSILVQVEASLSDELIEASYVSQVSGWSTTVSVPADEIDRPILRSWFWLAMMGLFLAALCFALTLLFTRRLARPIADLTAQARAIGEGRAAPSISTAIEEFAEVSDVLARASRERLNAEEQNRFLMGEMSHRAKNQYALIGAIARRAAKESSSTAEFQKTLADALASLARSSDLLAQSGWECAELHDLVLRQLQPFGVGRATGQFHLEGPELPLKASSVQTIGLALHELATNAAKYGALSVESGTVTIEWSATARFRLRWVERGGPVVVPPRRSGFGTLVIQTMTARGLGGDVRLDYALDGLVWEVDAPIETVRA